MIVRSKIIKMAMIKLKFVMKMENFSLIKMGTNTTRSKTQILQRKKRDKLETCTKYYKMHLSSLKYENHFFTEPLSIYSVQRAKSEII
jgi:hypothetical protein